MTLQLHCHTLNGALSHAVCAEILWLHVVDDCLHLENTDVIAQLCNCPMAADAVVSQLCSTSMQGHIHVQGNIIIIHFQRQPLANCWGSPPCQLIDKLLIQCRVPIHPVSGWSIPHGVCICGSQARVSRCWPCWATWPIYSQWKANTCACSSPVPGGPRTQQSVRGSLFSQRRRGPAGRDPWLAVAPATGTADPAELWVRLLLSDPAELWVRLLSEDPVPVWSSAEAWTTEGTGPAGLVHGSFLSTGGRPSWTPWVRFAVDRIPEEPGPAEPAFAVDRPLWGMDPAEHRHSALAPPLEGELDPAGGLSAVDWFPGELAPAGGVSMVDRFPEEMAQQDGPRYTDSCRNWPQQDVCPWQTGSQRKRPQQDGCPR